MKKSIYTFIIITTGLFACKPSDTSSTDFETTKQNALNDFTDVVAIPSYTALAAKADILNNAVIALNANTNQTNLDNAKNAWLELRAVWEQCEGFLFGPVDEDEYDPKMDTWPTDFNQMDSLINTSINLNQTTLNTIPWTLRGFHPLEYILFGNHGNRTPTGISTRQKEYMVSLAADILANCNGLRDSWLASGGNYGNLVKTAGQSSNQKYKSRSEMFLAIADGIIGICEEVSEGKMEEPKGATLAFAAPELVESPYSGNSTADFKNNIIGLENIYLGKFDGKNGTSLSSIVSAQNIALNNKIKSQISLAISSFDNITVYYEDAIYSQRPQIEQVQAQLDILKTTLEDELRPYLIQYIKD